MIVKIKIIEGGVKPEFKTAEAACADCYSRLDKSKWVWLKPVLIPLGFAMELDVGTEAIVRGRSGMGKKGHYVVHGTIDADFRGEISACMWSIFPFKIKNGMRIAQLAVRAAPTVQFNCVDKLTETARGSGGFGSTGV